MQIAAPLAEHFNVDYAAVEEWPVERLLKANMRLMKHLGDKADAMKAARKKARGRR